VIEWRREEYAGRVGVLVAVLGAPIELPLRHMQNFTKLGGVLSLGQVESANVDEDEVVAAHLKAAIPGVTVAVLLVTGVLVLKSSKGLPCNVCVTATTLGHGDKSFNNLAGRLLVVFRIPTSAVCEVQLIRAKVVP
jgi:hypothetical protein